jgi:hypothetical protein
MACYTTLVKQKSPGVQDFIDIFFVIFFLMIILLLRYTQTVVTRLTKYYPFSLLFQNRIVHYQYRHICEVLDVIYDLPYKTSQYFQVTDYDMDQYFVYVDGQFTTRKREQAIIKLHKKLIKHFGDQNVFISEFQNLDRIKVARSVLSAS